MRVIAVRREKSLENNGKYFADKKKGSIFAPAIRALHYSNKG